MPDDSIDAMALNRFIAEGRTEDLHLEFKTVSSEDFSQKEDRRNLAASLSGFANSDGGVIVWGVLARKVPDGVDCAKELRPLKRPAVVHSRLVELTGEAASPRIDGVTHEIVVCAAGSVIVTRIPASDRAPHMAKLGEDRYYKRNGASFYRMEHFDLADMFGRRRPPVLAASARVKEIAHRRITIVIALSNEGRASAKSPYFAAQIPPPFRRHEFGIDGNCHEGLPRIPQANRPNWCAYGSDPSKVIHPHITADIFVIECETPLEVPDIVSINCEYCAEDIPLKSQTVSVWVRGSGAA